MKNLFNTYQSLIYALAIFLLLSLWLASGYFSEQEVAVQPVNNAQRSLVPKVRVRTPELKRVSQEIVINGRTEPARAVTLRAEVEGRVIELGADEGANVRQGDLIVQLDMRDRQARLQEAKALLEQSELEFAGAKKLQKNNLQSEIEVSRVAAQLATAKALVKSIELEIENTRVVAPFDGILDRLPVEVGSYLGGGDELARLLEQDPVIFVGYVDQQERHRLVLGDRGIAHMVTGRIADGELRYIASEADPVTRTFKVEFEIPNPDGSLVSGITAALNIPVRYVSAFQLSPALLSLSHSDKLGIKVVNEQNVVEFLPVQVIRSTAEGLWISGLPEGTRIITVGQGFVQTGETVVPVDEANITNDVIKE
ncbi:MAG: efflux RND transporter periplasmic adaptor subunit [Gammaproteobacteria bacterium]|nr:efflux RND transporter periplasmic adaptor subunit [Gammaproteobacteria bacterium]